MNRRFPHSVMAKGKAKPRESSIVAACLQLLKLRGIFAWRNNTGVAMLPGRGGKPMPVRFGYPGSSDIFAIVKGGQFLAIECKTPLGPRGGGAKQSDDQVEFERRVKGAGGLYLLVRSGQELETYLDGSGV
jgi:hypothetical protein